MGESESEVAQSYPTLRDLMGCSLPVSSVHGIFQARVLEWVAISFSWWERLRQKLGLVVMSGAMLSKSLIQFSVDGLGCVSSLLFTWDQTMVKRQKLLEKAEEPEIKLPTSAGSWKKQESSRKTSISAFLTMPKPLTVWTTINYGKFWKRWEYQTTWPASWETCMQVRKQQLELNVEQQTGSK